MIRTSVGWRVLWQVTSPRNGLSLAAPAHCVGQGGTALEILEAPGAYPPTWLEAAAADMTTGFVFDDSFGERGDGKNVR